jgi:hypothetical protein
MSSVSAWPWLPLELVEQIVSDVWSSPLSTQDRITLMTSSLLVNKTFQATFLQVSSADVHIPCAKYGHQFLRILRRESPIFDMDTKVLPNIRCRSLTLYIQSNTHSAMSESASHEIYSDFSIFLYTIDRLGYLPNLRRVSMEYHNWDYGDLFESYLFESLPNQVTDLEIHYTFSTSMPPFLINALRSKLQRHECLPWSLPHVRNITVTGTSEAFVMDVAGICLNLEVLTTESAILDDVMTDDMKLLPPSVHTLILKMGLTERIDKLRILEVLGSGLFLEPHTVPLRIVVESGPVDQKALCQIRRQCEKYGVQFIHSVCAGS